MLQIATQVERLPWDFTRGDRMKRALKYAGLSRDEMAEFLDVAPATVSTWMNDRIVPSYQTMRLWSIKTGVPLEWLVHPPGLEPGTHCFEHGACIYCGEREDGSLATVHSIDERRLISAAPPTSPTPSGGALLPERSAAA